MAGMNDSMRIRGATAADAEVIASYNAAMALETEHKRLDLAVLRAGVEGAIRQPESAQYYLADVGGRVVGQLMVTFEWSDWRNADFWWIQSVYVHPDFRSRGVFKALYRHAETLARQAGACGLRLYVERDNTVAQAAYRRLGMTDAGYLVYETDWSTPPRN
jgi:ribosomal protein S18 acetylase RimI-like enzyme